MPPKRKSFLDQLEKESPSPAEPVRVEPPINANVRSKAADERTKSSVYLPPAVMDRLREIAFVERKRMHDLFMEGIDRVIESRGHPERTRPRQEV